MELPKPKRGSSPAMVVAIIALVFAVTGTSIAGVATISSLTKKEKKQTRAIAQSEIGKAAPGLAVASANTAGSAGNADKLDGLDSADFAPASRLHVSNRVALDDPIAGDSDFATATLLTVGPFSVDAECAQERNGFPTDVAQLKIVGPSGSSFAGSTTQFTVSLANGSAAYLAQFDNAGNEVEGGTLTVVGPGGQVLTISGSAETNDSSGDCVFAATAVGP